MNRDWDVRERGRSIRMVQIYLFGILTNDAVFVDRIRFSITLFIPQVAIPIAIINFSYECEQIQIIQTERFKDNVS